MNSLVRSATEATSLEAALALEASESFDLSGVVGERVLMFREANPERGFHADVEPGLEIDGQEDRIAQLLDKLLENAVEHGAERSEIRVALRRDEDWIVLVVENEGELLPKDKQAIFEAFATSGKNGNGDQSLGLGLFVAKAIAQAHAGQITARDNEDAPGARFEVRFPIEVT